MSTNMKLCSVIVLKVWRSRLEIVDANFDCIDSLSYLQECYRISESKHPAVTSVHTHPEDSVDSVSHSTIASTAAEHYRLGFQECLSETVHFLVEVEGFFARDSLCVQLINHLQQHCEKILATSE